MVPLYARRASPVAAGVLRPGCAGRGSWLVALSRADASRAVLERGGTVDPSITAGTDCLVVGRAPGAALEHAKGLGVQVLDEDGFDQWLAAAA